MNSAHADLVFLIDIDNTLLDHDAFKRHIGDWVDARPEAVTADHFWGHYEAVRRNSGIVNVLESARQFGVAAESPSLGPEMRRFLWQYPFREIMYPGVVEAIHRVGALGSLVVLCDGHGAFQRRKLRTLGVKSRLDAILVFDHKELYIPWVVGNFPAERYVLIDDKPRIHRAFKQALGERVTTVQVMQGHYAQSTESFADIRIDSFGSLSTLPDSLLRH